MRRPTGDRGAAAVELALVLPLLALVALACAPLVRIYSDHGHVVALSERGARFATRAERAPGRAGGATRPTPAEVVADVQAAARFPVTVSVDPAPADTLPGETVTVAVSATRPGGPLVAAADLVARFAGGDAVFPDAAVVIRSAVVMREE